MPNKRTRERHLAKLAARRAAARRRKHVQRWLAIGLSVVIVVAAGVLVLLNLNGKKSPAAAPTPSASLNASPGSNCSYAVNKSVNTGKKGPVKPPKFDIDVTKTYTATMKTSLGTFAIKLSPKDAPCTVNSFVYLTERGFYNGLTFHRIDTSLGVIQGGDPAGNGTGGPGYTMAEEVSASTAYPIGTVAMAKSSAPHTTGSQFFIVTGPGASSLPKQYTVIGHVYKGMSVVKKIAAQPVVGGTGSNAQQPKQEIVIGKVIVHKS